LGKKNGLKGGRCDEVLKYYCDLAAGLNTLQEEGWWSRYDQLL
jgi:hypothetical protein